MQINHNINAMITQHALFQNNTQMGKSLEKLSTGLKINRAQDDAAGLAMSEQMRTQIRGLGKAKQNAQDGIAALQIAEGGLTEVSNIMQRQRELAIQAANDTLTSTERKYLDLEFQELTKEIARISKTTDYNGKNMLNWNEDPNLSFGAIGDKNQLVKEMNNEYDVLQGYIFKLSDMVKGFINTDLISVSGGTFDFNDILQDGYTTSTITDASNPPVVRTDHSGIGIALEALKNLADMPNDMKFYIGDVLSTYTHADYETEITSQGVFPPLDSEGKPIPPPVDSPPDANWTVKGAWDAFAKAVSLISIGAIKTDIETLVNPLGAEDVMTLQDIQVLDAIKERLDIIVDNNANPKEDSLSRLYLTMVKNDMTNAASYTLHIGANYSGSLGYMGRFANEMTVTYISFNPGSLGLSTKNIKYQNNATETIDHMDKIIKSVNAVRAKIGTYVSRLEHTINNIASLEFNTQDAESRIRDTDFAQATTDFTRNQILVQSATSMLAQANSLPQTALSLING